MLGTKDQSGGDPTRAGGGDAIVKPGRIFLFVVAPLLVLMLPLAVYLADRSMNNGTLPRNVAIAGIDVAGLPPDEAFTVVRAYQEG
ncbi:MAG: hypothetical protein U9N78_06175, partial [Actinomycetota bacterium]|nr:hypothetical protein [Actinomycetota bacterium]